MSEDPIIGLPPVAPPEKMPFLPTSVVAGGVFALVLLAGIWWMSRRPPSTQPPPSAESLAYLAQIQLTDFHMSQADNMVGSNIIYLDGKIANVGSKTVRHLRVRLFFYDNMSQIVLKEEQDIIPVSAPPLTAGETRDFQLRFDRLPAPWNYQPPQFQLVALEFP